MSGAGRNAADAEWAERGRHPSVEGESPDGWTAVMLPGSGSDEVFVRAAFERPLRSLGIRLIAPAPCRDAEVVDGYRSALDAVLARTDGPLLVGGISLGAHVAARWAVRHRSRITGLLLALPAWTGQPGRAPAALAARATADLARGGGPAAAVAAARAGAPRWLADELERAWRGYGTGLADALTAATGEPAPDDRMLGLLAAPAAVVGLVDDPVHPLAVARHWCDRLPRAALLTTTLCAVGADPAVLGRAAVLGWLRSRALSRHAGAGQAGLHGTGPSGCP